MFSSDTQPDFLGIINAMPDFVFWKDVTGVFRGCNHAFAKFCFGCSCEQVVGKNDLDLVSDPEQAAALRREDISIMANASPRRSDIWFTLADGSRRCFDARKIPLVRTVGDVYGLLVVARDITDTKRLGEALLESEVRYRTLFSNMSEGFALQEIICDQHGIPCDYRFLEINAAFEQLTGLTRTDVVGKCLLEVMPGEDPYWIEAFGRVALTGTAERFTRYSSVLKRYYSVCAYSPAPRQFALLFMDITDRTLLQEELDRIMRHEQERYGFHTIVTNNPAMKMVLELAARVSEARQTTVALFGESGSGKEMLARAIHTAGSCLPGTFVAVNCVAVPENLLESELFGHVRGAFTGADHDREGKFSAAKGGTLFLDEIGDMSLPLQAKLLRVLEERSFEKAGGNVSLPADCRIIVSTNRDLSQLVMGGRFREDLYHRINVFPLRVPPLRERKEDIPLLSDHLLNTLQQTLGRSLTGISHQAMQQLLSYHWPGNVRELRNCLERAAIFADGGTINSEHLVLGTAVPVHSPVSHSGDAISYNLSIPPADLALDTLLEQILAITLERCNGNKAQAARLLRIGRSTYYRSKLRPPFSIK